MLKENLNCPITFLQSGVVLMTSVIKFRVDTVSRFRALKC